MKKIFMAMISGKSKEEVYDMLNDSEKEILFGIAQSMGMSRVERRKMKRKYEKRRQANYCQLIIIKSYKKVEVYFISMIFFLPLYT